MSQLIILLGTVPPSWGPLLMGLVLTTLCVCVRERGREKKRKEKWGSGEQEQKKRDANSWRFWFSRSWRALNSLTYFLELWEAQFQKIEPGVIYGIEALWKGKFSTKKSFLKSRSTQEWGRQGGALSSLWLEPGTQDLPENLQQSRSTGRAGEGRPQPSLPPSPTAGVSE